MLHKIAAAALLLTATAAAAQPEPVVQIEDVELFYNVYDSASGRPGADVLQRDYIDAGSDGLRTFFSQRRTTAERLAQAIASRPEIYTKGRNCLAALPRAKQRLQVALSKLADIYHEASFPPVTIAVGRGRPVAIGGPETGIQIGLEALCAVDFFHANLEDRFVYVIAHEFVHVQQSSTLAEREDLTVLERSLLEGAAEFVAELMSGDVAYAHLRERVAGKEAEIETAFQADMDSRDFSKWLDNTGSYPNPDLGYWTGYRIVRAYYQRASDKQQAIRDILQMTDAHAFVDASGWRPGINFAQR
jgi:hypothetical protein